MIDWLNPTNEMLAGLQAGREEMQNKMNQLYTQEELDKAVKEWKDKLYSFLQGLEIQNISEFLEEAEMANYQMLSVMVTQKIEKAVNDEREACAMICEENAKLSDDYQGHAHILDARVIRKRG